MQTQPPSSFCAAAAIAAALVLGSTAAAQDVAPAADVPTVAPPAPVAAAAAPATVASGPIIQSNPVVQAIPPEPVADPAARAEAAPRQRTARPRSAPRSVAAQTAPAAAAAPVAAPPMETVPAVPVAPSAAAVAPPPPIAAAPAPIARTNAIGDGLSGAEAGLLALLAAGGLAGAGFLVSGKRRRRDDFVEAAEIDRAPIVPATATAVPETAFTPAPEAAEATAARRVGSAGSGRSAVPAGAVPTGEARDALLQQMVDAQPDEANPFTSRKSRRKRARLILQHREHLADTGAAEAFDWRTYRSAATDPRVRETEAAPA